MEYNVSVVMVIHNEEAHLENALKNLHFITDDIVIIHDGKCIDKSKGIALQYGAKFYEKEFIGMCEGHRIASIMLAKYEWVFILDADEVISDELVNNIPSLISSKSIDAYEFIWPLFDGEKVICDTWPNKRTLFRKSKIKYIDFPHMDFKTNGKLKQTSLVLHHFPKYNNYTFKSFKNKWYKWIKIQAKATMLDFNQFNKIGYDNQLNWSKYFLFKRKFPELFLLYGLYDFYKSLLSGGFKGGIHSIKSSFMWGAYNAAVYYNVTKIKWKKY